MKSKPKESILKITGEKIVHKGKFTTRKDIYFLDREGKEGVWETIERKTYGKIVAVFPVTKQKEVVLTKIFRIPFNAWVIELCAGLADRKGEAPQDLARRELLEETGYHADELTLLLEGPLSAGLTKEEMMIFFAPDVEKIAEPQLEPAEDIEVILVPIDTLVDFVENLPKDVRIDMKILSALPILQKRGLL